MNTSQIWLKLVRTVPQPEPYRRPRLRNDSPEHNSKPDVPGPDTVGIENHRTNVKGTML